MKLIIILLFFSTLFSGCNLRERELNVEKKEAELMQKEQELNLLAKTLQIKEEELIKREKRLDSTSLSDTTGVYNSALVGKWLVRMTCTETTCTGSAVGDVKNEQWNISYQNNNIIATAMDAGKIVRVYSGIYTGNTVELVEDRQSTASQPATKMIVRLRVTNDNTLEGQREIVRENGCKIIYALQMSKQPSV
jgi:hypothetical protein